MTDLKVGLWLAKRLIYNITSRNYFYHEAVLSYGVWKGVGSQHLPNAVTQDCFMVKIISRCYIID